MEPNERQAELIKFSIYSVDTIGHKFMVSMPNKNRLSDIIANLDDLKRTPKIERLITVIHTARIFCSLGSDQLPKISKESRRILKHPAAGISWQPSIPWVSKCGIKRTSTNPEWCQECPEKESRKHPEAWILSKFERCWTIPNSLLKIAMKFETEMVIESQNLKGCFKGCETWWNRFINY